MLYKDIFDPIVYNVFGLGKNRIGQLKFHYLKVFAF